MSDEALPTGPDPEAIKRTILERYPETVVAEAMGATFFSLDESSWPNYATIVTTDEHDIGTPSRLTERDGAFRLNLAVGKATFERLVGGAEDPDHAGLDSILPPPVYATQRWIWFVNPSDATFRDVVLPLIDEAHNR